MSQLETRRVADDGSGFPTSPLPLLVYYGALPPDPAVVFGGPSGQEVTVQAGDVDVVVIPAGVAHRNVGQSTDLLVVGAYPGGSGYGIRCGDPAEREAAVRAVAAVSLPGSGPVLGRDGGLRCLWKGGMPGPGQPGRDWEREPISGLAARPEVS